MCAPDMMLGDESVCGGEGQHPAMRAPYSISQKVSTRNIRHGDVLVDKLHAEECMAPGWRQSCGGGSRVASSPRSRDHAGATEPQKRSPRTQGAHVLRTPAAFHGFRTSQKLKSYLLPFPRSRFAGRSALLLPASPRSFTAKYLHSLLSQGMRITYTPRCVEKGCAVHATIMLVCGVHRDARMRRSRQLENISVYVNLHEVQRSRLRT